MEVLTPPKPLFLFADSALLFRRRPDGLWLDTVRACLDADGLVEPVTAAYLGASNGDLPEYFELFEAAMAGIGLTQTVHVRAEPTAAQLEALQRARLVLLAGGDARVGWQALRQHGVDQLVLQRYHAGAVLLGVSAGAMQLGRQFAGDESQAPLQGLGLVPFCIGVHEPGSPSLLKTLQRAGPQERGLAIPSGGGVAFHPDYTLEPLVSPVSEWSYIVDDWRESMIAPGGPPKAPVLALPAGGELVGKKPRYDA